MSTCSKNKYKFWRITHNTHEQLRVWGGCWVQTLGKLTGYVGSDCFGSPSLLSCFDYYLFYDVITVGVLIDEVLTLAPRLLKKMLFKITDSCCQ